jgi:hypothetical protein
VPVQAEGRGDAGYLQLRRLTYSRPMKYPAVIRPASRTITIRIARDAGTVLRVPITAAITAINRRVHEQRKPLPAERSVGEVNGWPAPRGLHVSAESMVTFGIGPATGPGHWLPRARARADAPPAETSAQLRKEPPGVWAGRAEPVGGTEPRLHVSPGAEPAGSA